MSQARATWRNLRMDEGPQAGDLAIHRGNHLDSRPVMRVEGQLLWLGVGENEIGPFDIFNYEYKRKATN